MRTSKQSPDNPTRSATGPLRILWLPTWDLPNFQQLIPSASDLKRAEARGVQIWLKPHPQMPDADIVGARLNGVKVLKVPLDKDLYDVVCSYDGLVTDVSSILFDYSLTGRPMAFLGTAVDAFVGGQRGTYDEPREIMGNLLLQSWVDVIDYFVNGPDEHQVDQLERIRSRYNAFLDDKSCIRIMSRLLDEGRRNHPRRFPVELGDSMKLMEAHR